ncbi:MAG: hypothetical protein WD267_05085 [Balneolales bacterium]
MHTEQIQQFLIKNVRKPLNGRKEAVKHEPRLEFYIKSIELILLGWQSPVFLLNRYLNDLTKELNDIYEKYISEHTTSNFALIRRLMDREIDYVTDNEYIDAIKFILERWHPELLNKQYIWLAYEGLELRKKPFENTLGFDV